MAAPTASKNFSSLTALTAPEDADELYIQDASEAVATAKPKRITRANMFAGGVAATPQTITGVKKFSALHHGFGNNVDHVNDGYHGIEVRNLIDDYDGVGSGIQVQSVLDLTGTPLSNSGKLVTNSSGIVATALDAGTAPHVYWSSYEGAMVFNPGSAYTLPEMRLFESDPTVSSGTVTTLTGFNARTHGNTSATIPLLVGFHNQGPEGGANNNTYTDQIGFLHRYDQSASLSATFTNLYGMVIDAPDKIHATGTLNYTNAYGLWLNGSGAGADIVFGDNKNARIITSDYATGGDILQVVCLNEKTDAPASNAQGFVGRFNLSGALGSKVLSGLNGIIHTVAASSGAASTGSLYGGDFATLFQGTQQVPMGAALNCQYFNTAIATHAAAIGLRVQAGFNTGGTLTNLDGIRVEKQLTGATNAGIFLNGDDVGADIVFGAGRDVKQHWNGANLEFEFAAGDPYDTTGNPVTSTGFIPIAVNGTVYKFLVAT